MKTTYNYANTSKWSGSNPLEMPAVLQESVLNVGRSSGVIQRSHTQLDYLANILIIAVSAPVAKTFDMSLSLTWGNALEVTLFAVWLFILGHSLMSLYETNREARRSVLTRSLEYDIKNLLVNGEPVITAETKKLKTKRN